MTWLEIRAYYIALHARARIAGQTQRAIGGRGGTGQNNISRLLTNDKLGPRVGTFVRAVEGLGVSLAQFFVELEHETVSSVSSPSPSPTIASSDPGRSTDGRAPYVSEAPLDQQQIADLIRAATESIVARLDRIDAKMATLDARDGQLPAPEPPVRTSHFG